MAGAYWYTEMPMAGTGTGTRLCAPAVRHASHMVNPFTRGFQKSDAISTLADAAVWPMGTPGGSTG